MTQPQSAWPTGEQATLAAATRDPGFLATVLDAGDEVFTHATSRRVWQIMAQLREQGHRVDRAAVELALGQPLDAHPSTDYWPVLLEQRLHRQLGMLGRWLNKPHDHLGATAVAARALQSLNQALTATQQSRVFGAEEVAADGLSGLALGDPTWLSAGVTLWDTATAGWGPQDLVLLGARPSQGKSALGVQWAWNTAQSGRGVAFCSVEMAPAAIGVRALSQITGLPKAALQGIALAWPTTQDPQVLQALTHLRQWPLRVIDANGASVADLQAAVARAEYSGPRIDVVIIDYLQLLQSSRRESSREQEISRMSRDLKAWARRDGRLVVALSQLKRPSDAAPDHVPSLSDLRESGALEQDADGVAFIHHTEAGGVDLIMAKNRNGPTGRVPVRWEPSTTVFY